MHIESAVLNTDIDTARQKWREYAAIENPTEAEDLARRSFRQMAFGRQVIDLNLAIEAGGFSSAGLPAFAIARAHWPFVHAWWSDGRIFFTRVGQNWSTRGNALQRKRSPSARITTAPARQTSGRAQVPSIPPSLRPDTKSGQPTLSAYFILFEAKWEPEPPVDPVLVSHLGGPFYVVRAHWELTPLEQGLLRELL